MNSRDKNLSKDVNEWDEKSLRDLAVPLAPSGRIDVKERDIDFVQDCRALLRRQGIGARGWFLWLVIALTCGLVWWASWAELPEVTRGVGRVIPSKSVQLIQSLEGGILEEILVEEGQQVEEGDPLVRIDDAIFLANYHENLARRDELIARIARHRAEAEGFEPLRFEKGTREDLAELQRQLYEKRKTDYLATRESLEKRLKLAKDAETLMEAGRKTGAISPVELITTQKEVADLEGQLLTLKTSMEREAAELLDTDNAGLVLVEHALSRDKDRLDRTTMRAPVRGTVNKIHINTSGRVIASGEDIMEIVPLDDSLLIEANIRPSDIAFIRPGQDADVKFTAYDFAVYGALEGKVEHLSVDTIKDEQGDSFYLVKVRTEKGTLGRDRHGQDLTIMPGMVTEVDIITGKKTVLDYLMKPLTRARERALRER